MVDAAEARQRSQRDSQSRAVGAANTANDKVHFVTRDAS